MTDLWDRIPAPFWIALAAAVAGFALRKAADAPHAFYVGLGAGAITFGVAWAIRAIGD